MGLCASIEPSRCIEHIALVCPTPLGASASSAGTASGTAQCSFWLALSQSYTSTLKGCSTECLRLPVFINYSTPLTQVLWQKVSMLCLRCRARLGRPCQ